MAKKNIKSYVKWFNSEVLKLSWVYIIVISLLALATIQLYRTVAATPQPKTNDSTLTKQVEQLENELHNQQRQLDALKQKIDTLTTK